MQILTSTHLFRRKSSVANYRAAVQEKLQTQQDHKTVAQQLARAKKKTSRLQSKESSLQEIRRELNSERALTQELTSELANVESRQLMN